MHTPSGTLEVIVGPMFAGKTETLILRMSLALQDEEWVELLKPLTDTRYPGEEVISHNGRKMGASWTQPDLENFPSKAAVVGIDEAQFLSPEAIPVILAAVKRGQRVILAGLDLYSTGLPFGPMPTFMAYADKVTKVRGLCSRCPAPSTRSQRLCSSEGGAVLIGGADTYEPRCLACFDPH